MLNNRWHENHAILTKSDLRKNNRALTPKNVFSKCTRSVYTSLWMPLIISIKLHSGCVGLPCCQSIFGDALLGLQKSIWYFFNFLSKTMPWRWIDLLTSNLQHKNNHNACVMPRFNSYALRTCLGLELLVTKNQRTRSSSLLPHLQQEFRTMCKHLQHVCVLGLAVGLWQKNKTSVYRESLWTHPTADTKRFHKTMSIGRKTPWLRIEWTFHALKCASPRRNQSDKVQRLWVSRQNLREDLLVNIVFAESIVMTINS